MVHRSRRRALQVAGTAITAGLAGCLSGVEREVTEQTNELVQWVSPTVDYPASLAFAGGRLYAGTFSGVEAFSMSGERVWERRFEDPDDDVVSRPGTVAASSEIVVTRGSATLQALDPDDGSTRWTKDIGRAVGQTRAVGGRVYAGGDRLVAYDASDGATVWDADRPAGYLAVDADRDRLYTAGDAGVVHAFDARSGDHQWSFETGARTAPPGVAPAGETIYAATSTPDQPGTLFALDAATGDERWQAPIAKPADLSAPAVGADHVFVASFGERSGLFTAFDRADGTEAWTRPTESWRYAHPVAADGTVYVKSEGMLAIDAASGDVRWRFDAAGTTTRPLVVGDRLYTTSDNGIAALALD